MKETDFRFSASVLAWPLYLVLSLWLVYTIEIIFPGDFSHFGILPRTISGLRGIVLSPFLHGDIGHLFNNSIPLFILVAALRFFYRKESLKVLVLGVLRDHHELRSHPEWRGSRQWTERDLHGRHRFRYSHRRY